ncbi:hypothetical protein GCM10023214_48560 [Amycolatopsis dongchuanensis]|uniref:Uncharacterized protein n=1 Tax=Amycolatopsis dongchuanensis TaxID=1070866 RepID=A0ABP9R1J5_9PSEU
MRLRRDLDEVEIRLLGQPERILDPDDPDLLTVGSDKTDFGNTDAFVDTCLGADVASLVRGKLSSLLDLVPTYHTGPGAGFPGETPTCGALFRSHPPKAGASPPRRWRDRTRPPVRQHGWERGSTCRPRSLGGWSHVEG